MENSVIFAILNATAWHMDAPPLFGAFHIAASVITVLAALAGAAYFARRINDRTLRIDRVLSATGWILLILEIYKQLFLYYVVSGGAYDWWFFPFQLCSVPMYLCILLPFTKGMLRSAFLTFMSGYTFIGAAAALAYPQDILRPYVSLTVHGFVWHGLLFFISLLIMFTGAADVSVKGLAGAAALFGLFCIIAVLINAAVEPVMQAAYPGIAHSWAAMFYMNPYHISPQPIVDSVQKTAGIPAGLVLYALVISAVSSCVNVLTSS